MKSIDSFREAVQASRTQLEAYRMKDFGSMTGYQITRIELDNVFEMITAAAEAYAGEMVEQEFQNIVAEAFALYKQQFRTAESSTDITATQAESKVLHRRLAEIKNQESKHEKNN